MSQATRTVCTCHLPTCMLCFFLFCACVVHAMDAPPCQVFMLSLYQVRCRPTVRQALAPCLSLVVALSHVGSGCLFCYLGYVELARSATAVHTHVYTSEVLQCYLVLATRFVCHEVGQSYHVLKKFATWP